MNPTFASFFIAIGIEKVALSKVSRTAARPGRARSSPREGAFAAFRKQLRLHRVATYQQAINVATPTQDRARPLSPDSLGWIKMPIIGNEG